LVLNGDTAEPRAIFIGPPGGVAALAAIASRPRVTLSDMRAALGGAMNINAAFCAQDLKTSGAACEATTDPRQGGSALVLVPTPR
jgi:hypothetical protein